MSTPTAVTETVVRNHLQAFVEQQGTAAIVQDYDESARFYSETEIYDGKQQIGGFFTDFIDSLPAGAIERFALRSLWVDGGLAYITWSAGVGIPLGTDTFVVTDGKTISKLETAAQRLESAVARLERAARHAGSAESQALAAALSEFSSPK